MRLIPKEPSSHSTIQKPYASKRLQVEARAYEIYEQRGKIDGYDMQDWLQAEAELGRPARSQLKAA